MSVTINGTGNTITPVTVNTTGSVNGITPQASNMQPFNRIINGAMTIDQRNAGAAFSVTDGAYCLDRWWGYSSQASKYTVQQNAGSVTPPVGFSNYLGVTVTSSVTVGGGDYFSQSQKIEAYNIADLNWGTANAKTVTLSFWVYSSLTGTFGGGLRNGNNSYSYPFAYTILSANTWEQKTITVTGPTSGTWTTTNDTGVGVFFGLGVGSTYTATAGSWQSGNYISATGVVSVVGTSGATFYITGVQLEAGSTASSFAHEDYGTTLQKCQRYYQTASVMWGVAYSSTQTAFMYKPSVTMRSLPTLPQPTAPVYIDKPGNYDKYQSSANVTIGGNTNTYSGTGNGFMIYCDNFSGMVAGDMIHMRGEGGVICFNSEL